MPIKLSAKKALRQSKKRQIFNLAKKIAMKNVVKKIKKLAVEKKYSEAQKLIPLAYKAIDKSAKTGVIKENAASRKKSRLMKLITEQKTSS